MFSRFLLIFITVPLVEMVLLMFVSKYIGIGGTLMLIILTGTIGATLARSQGLGVLHKLQNSLQSGIPPTDTLIEGVLVLIGGIVLLTPGILTDAVGFSLMAPVVRKKAAQWLKGHFLKQIQNQTASQFQAHFHSSPPPHQRPQAPPGSGKQDDIIDI